MVLALGTKVAVVARCCARAALAVLLDSVLQVGGGHNMELGGEARVGRAVVARTGASALAVPLDTVLQVRARC